MAEALGSEVRSQGPLRSVADAQEGRAFYWAPVMLFAGIWLYFALPAEPAWPQLAPLVLAGIALFWLGRGKALPVMLALVIAGLVLAKVRSDLVSVPVLRASSPEVALTGIVEGIDRTGEKRFAMRLAVEQIEGLLQRDQPRRLRISFSARQGSPRIGDRVAFKARLMPLPSPVEPGGFDYGRRLWFQGLGGTGRATAEIATIGGSGSLRHALPAMLADLRHEIGRRIFAQLEGPIASFAEALITGERASIPANVNRSLQESGLFHILSISGLHMWLVAGGVFWIVRAALALVPALALKWPIKKWAASAALAMGFFYMLLADSGVATERSYMMIAIVFFAVLVDRPALSFRNLALAAMIVLVIQPEAAVDASFQMSFLAVLGLVAFHEWWRRWRRNDMGHIRHGAFRRMTSRVCLGILAGLATTLVAGAMSSIPAAYHFGRIAPLSLIANGLALPVMGVVVMPMALAATLLMPFGLEALPLWIMGKGLELVIAISDWVQGLSGAQTLIAQPQAPGVAMMALGTICVSLLAGPVRFAGLAVFCLGAGTAAWPQPRPDVLIERTGQNAAIRNDEGRLVPAHGRRGRYAVEKWLQRQGDNATPADAARRPGWTCTKGRCDAVVRGKRLVYMFEETKAPGCGAADIVIASFPLRGACKGAQVRIDRIDLWRSGAVSVWLGENGVRIKTARREQGDRPWAVAPLARKKVFAERRDLPERGASTHSPASPGEAWPSDEDSD